MRQLYNSEYTGIPAYLMDFGFGGFLGYGKGVLTGLVNEEHKRMKMCATGAMAMTCPRGMKKEKNDNRRGTVR